ncbi:hypothetical protein [Ammoniphilus sp. YIM 78166]|uniref:hypothetical protein n=1 Tax=Ammoniphilus sp. YIM 78166 TaxID=1644106 RepID=UPI00142FEDE5|nr:hypothetical protein [Ammoniphilus sp. YIM 78166]
MAKSNTPWFASEWLQYWERKSQPSRWNKAKALLRQNQITDLQIEECRVRSQVKEDSVSRTVQVDIEIKGLSPEEKDEVLSMYLSQPALIMRVYSGTITEEEAFSAPFSLGFFLPRTAAACSCGERMQPCLHILATVWAVAERVEEDPSSFLLMNGVPWELVLQHLGEQEGMEKAPRSAADQYKMVPLPEIKGIPEGKKKQMQVTPPFWTSPFPYVFIMQEIYDKVVQEARHASANYQRKG